MKPLVNIEFEGQTSTHLPNAWGDYSTLCGEDGGIAGDAAEFGQASDAPRGSKVTCRACQEIWKVCRNYSKRYFAVSE